MIRAVICDIYGTLLEVGPPRPGATVRWVGLWQSLMAEPTAPTLEEMEAAIRPLVVRQHARGRALGLVQPEVDWPALAAEAFPCLLRLAPAERAHLFLLHARLARTTRLAAGAAACLRAAREAGVALGIASNAQACTRVELAEALSAEGLAPDFFAGDLSFYSYEHGVAKPDPRVFTWLTARLAARGVAPREILMVGDRTDADVAPSEAAGWNAWWLQAQPGPRRGGWEQLREWLVTA